MSIAFLFSGQGAQYAGMGKELYQAYSEVKEAIDEAGEILGLDMAALCFDEDERLHWTPYTQPAILAFSYGLDQLLKNKGIAPNMAAGLSLGEYSALVSAGVLSYEDAVMLVHQRGTFMEEAVPEGKGAMAAVMGADNALIESICNQVSKQHYVQPANYNMPGQVSIAGEAEGVEEASRMLEEQGAKRVVPLKVSGPFHTQLLKPAADKLEAELKKYEFKPYTIPVYGNTTATAFKSTEDIQRLLVQQVMSPVRFDDMIRNMIQDEATTFVELGPGKTLSRFVKKIDRSANVMNVENEKTLTKTLESLTK